MTQSGKDQQLKSPGDAENGSVHCHVIFVTANPTSLRVVKSNPPTSPRCVMETSTFVIALA
jgi:hypothetical protein